MVNETQTSETEQVTPEVENQTGRDNEKGKKPVSFKSAKGGKKDDEQKSKLTEMNQQLQEENEKQRQELTETKDIYQRMLAEYANYKRRTDQEKEQLSSFVKSETLKALLPALDNLERAVEAPPGDEYKKGIDMIIRQLNDILKSQGLDVIMPIGEIFDPEIHNAVVREDAQGIESDTVTEVFQKGYRLGERLLRPAMVKVAN